MLRWKIAAPICAITILTASMALGSNYWVRDGVGDNAYQNVRPIPPKGVELSAVDREELTLGIQQLSWKIDSLRKSLQKKPELLDLLPDVMIYHKAVDWAVRYGEFFNAREIPVAKELIKQGLERARQLEAGKPQWPAQTGLVVRGYVSDIDGSVQPYGLVVPASWNPNGAKRHRLDLWWHGRGEVLSELNFINDRQRSAGEFTPPDAFVLHPYGRYCNANKMAGEVDTFEAMLHAKLHYRIDRNRQVARGFSMGGAACWQFAAHYPGMWAAAAPGAGFSETPDFLKVFQRETLQPTWFEQKLWQQYDCTGYALNLWNLPTVAYSGENDSQKQAADMMEKAMAAEGLKLDHIIGYGAGHNYTAPAKMLLNAKIDTIVANGRNPAPKKLKFVTYTLTYNNIAWLHLLGLGKHWERAQVEAEITGPNEVRLTTKNVTRLALRFEEGLSPFAPGHPVKLVVDGESMLANASNADGSFTAEVLKPKGKWRLAEPGDFAGLRKKPELQGPVDDAFFSKFLFVKPSGKPMNPAVGGWVESEMNRAIKEWRSQYRGDARVKLDTEVTPQDIRESNLVLWGDPQSNKLIAQLLPKLPIKWDATNLEANGTKYASAGNAPILIYPNPLSEHRYVVLNSSFTFREYDYLNNARQVPKLPDWAVVDLSEKPNSRWPGKIAAAGFFGEKWEWVRPNGASTGMIY
jgi:pimeloyl-ACP methyl ester carboxylesterase